MLRRLHFWAWRHRLIPWGPKWTQQEVDDINRRAAQRADDLRGCWD